MRRAETAAVARAITLRHLLTHSSGFVYDMWNADMARYLEVTGKPGIISCTNAALDLPLVFDPGTAWDYGIGIDWAGKAVEAVSGKTLGVWLAENLFGPLGMRDTGFRSGDDQRARLARIHARTPEGIVATDLEIPAGAGIRNGRRRALFHGSRLSSFRPDDFGRRRAGRCARAGGADRRADGRATPWAICVAGR